MINFLVNKYYSILIVVFVFVVFNVTIRDKVINWIVNPNPARPITENANAYANETFLRNIFVYTLWGSLSLVGIISLILLFLPEGKELSKWILISVPAILVLLFLCVMLLGGFS